MVLCFGWQIVGWRQVVMRGRMQAPQVVRLRRQVAFGGWDYVLLHTVGRQQWGHFVARAKDSLIAVVMTSLRRGQVVA